MINNGTVKRLVIKGNATGAEQAFEITGTTGLSVDHRQRRVDRSRPSLASAQDAQLDVDGIVVSRSSNTVDDVIDGVTLTLNKRDVGNASTLTITDDRSSATTAINAFVSAYSNLNTTIKSLTAYNATTQTAASLSGDSTARSIQSQLRTMLGNAISGLGGAQRLSDIGVSFTSTGTLEVNSTKLSAALADRSSTWAPSSPAAARSMALRRCSERIDGYIASDGMIAGRTDGINTSIKSIDSQRERLNAWLTLDRGALYGAIHRPRHP